MDYYGPITSKWLSCICLVGLGQSQYGRCRRNLAPKFHHIHAPTCLSFHVDYSFSRCCSRRNKMYCRTFAVRGRARAFAASRRQAFSLFRRQFSVKAIYSSSPATLHYYCPRRSSALFDCKENDGRQDDISDEAVTVEKDGLVYPAVNAPSG